MKTLKICVALGALALAGCGGEDGRQPEGARSAAAMPVSAVAAEEQQWPATYEATGTVRAAPAATVSSRIMSSVLKVDVQAGDRVREHQLLITLDSREIDTGRHRAEAGLAEVKAAIPEADHAMAAAKANLDLAQATFRRIAELNEKKSVSAQEFDEASARLKAAQAAYDMARARRTQLDSKIAQAEQEVRAAAVMQGYSRIEAPFAGVVTAKPVEPGNMATPGAPLVTIEREGGYRLEAQVDESRLPAVKAGQAVQVSLEALDRKLGARVSEVVPSVDPASRSYVVKIDLPAAAGVRSGMFGRAEFALGARKVIAAPAAAVQERGQLASVFVVEGGTARTRLITIGQRTKDAVEVLSGLAAGERVVSPVPAVLEDGAKVEVRQ